MDLCLYLWHTGNSSFSFSLPCRHWRCSAVAHHWGWKYPSEGRAWWQSCLFLKLKAQLLIAFVFTKAERAFCSLTLSKSFKSVFFCMQHILKMSDYRRYFICQFTTTVKYTRHNKTLQTWLKHAGKQRCLLNLKDQINSILFM